jgi:hypothetical protein
MGKSSRAKQERVVEAIRHGLDGEAAVEFIHQNGFAITAPGFARFVRQMGGRKKILDMMAAGANNAEILGSCLPEEEDNPIETLPPNQRELFTREEVTGVTEFHNIDGVQFEFTKFTVKMPTDLYTAIGLAAKVENKRRNDLIVDILTEAMSRMPELKEDGV